MTERHFGKVQSYDRETKRGLVKAEDGRAFYFKADDAVGLDPDAADIDVAGKRVYIAEDPDSPIQMRAQQVVLLDSDDD